MKKSKLLKMLLAVGVFILTLWPTATFSSTVISPPNTTECWKYFKVQASKTSPIADGKDYTTLTFSFVQNPGSEEGGCKGGGAPIMAIKVVISGGTGNTLSKSTINASNLEGTTFPSITLKSTSAGVKNITVYISVDPEIGFDTNNPYPGGSITFKAPATKITTTTKPATAPTPPAPPAPTALVIGDQQYKETNQYQFEKGETVQFSGKTVSNGKITLTFNSEPFTDTVTADANGNWTYILTEDLGEGEHTMTYTVTDPKTKLTSAPTQPVSFELVKTEEPVVEPVLTGNATTETQDYFWWYVGGAGVFVVLASVIGFLAWKKKAKKLS